MADPKMKFFLEADVSGLTNGLAEGAKLFKGTAKQIEAIGGGISKTFAGFMAPVTALLGLLGGGAFLKGTVEKTKEWTVESQKLARVLGTTTENGSSWATAIERIFGDVETFIGLASKLPKTINANEEQFARFGISIRDGLGHLKPMQDILLATFESLAKLKEGTDRNTAAQKLFGRSYVEVLKYMQINKQAIQEAREENERLGMVVGGDLTEKTKAYRQSVEGLDHTMNALKIRIGTELMPVLTEFNEAIAEKGPEAVGLLGQAFQWSHGIILALREQMEKFLRSATFVWEEFASGATAAWSQLKAIATGNVTEAKAIQMGFHAYSLARAKEYLRDLADIEASYAAKQHTVMGLGPKAKGKTPTATGDLPDDPAKAKENLYQQELLKIEEDKLKFALQETLDQKERIELRKVELDLAKELQRYEKERKAGSLSGDEERDLASRAAANAEQARVDVRAKFAEQRRQLVAKVQDIELSETKRHGAALLKLEEDQDTFLQQQGLMSATEVLSRAKDREAKLYAIERQGLAERLALVNLDPAERARINAEIEALEDQHNQRMQVLRQREAQDRASSSFLGGLGAYVAQAQTALSQWGTWVQGVVGGVENAFASGINGILTGQMTLSQGIKAIWSGIVQSVAGAVAQLIAKWIVMTAIKKALGIQDAATDGVRTSAALTTAAAETWSAYAGIPFAGPALAAAQIAFMFASMAGVTAAATAVTNPFMATALARGGIIDRPTLALMGEEFEPELVAPERDFKAWAGGLVNLGANLGANVSTQLSQARGYDLYGSNLASAASRARAEAGSGEGIPGYHDLRGATIITMDATQWARAVQKGLVNHGELFG